MKPLPLFLDLDAHAWYMPYVETAFEARLITGYPDRTFKPRRSLTVEEAIALILRAYHEDGFTDSVRISPAIDNRQGEWFTRYINGAIDRNLLSNAEQFTLGRAITRGQFFDIAYRMDYIRLQNMARYDRPETWNQPPERVNLPRAPLVPPNNAYQNRPTTTASNPVFRPAVTSPSNQIFISIPALGIQNLRVSHATDMTHNGLLAPLKYGVGHLFGYPGGNGKILIYGHSSSYGWDVSPYTKIFRKINLLKPGDRVTVTYGGQIHQYEMTHSQSVPAGDMTPYRGSGEELLLYTCWPPDSIKLRWVAHLRPVR
jgi:LPXTG-site transpeptidase (sortase) family protein